MQPKRTKKFLFVLLLLLGVSFAFVAARLAFVSAYVPGEINFQGKITDINGVNIANGNYNFQVRIYNDPTAGTAQNISPATGTATTSNINLSGVAVQNGIFNLKFSPNPSVFNGNTDLYLQVCFDSPASGIATGCVGGDYDKVFAPRKKITSNPYSLVSAFLGSNLIQGGTAADAGNGVLVFVGTTSPTAPVAGNDQGRMYFDSTADKFKCSENGSAFFDCFSTTASVTTIGTIDTQTKSANGAVISGSSLYMQTADASFPGLVSTGTQTFAGAKTFSGALTASNTLGVNGLASLNAGTAVTGGNLSFAGSSSNAVVMNPYGTSSGNTSEIRFLELVANGSNYIGFKSPDNAGTSNSVYTLPAFPGSSGEVLSSTTAGILSWTTPNAGTVTGTGVANRVTYWNGTSSITSDANFLWDGTTFSALGTGGVNIGSGRSYGIDSVQFLRSSSDEAAVFIGKNAGLNSTDATSVIIGLNSGGGGVGIGSSGSGNVFIGHSSAQGNVTGSLNTYIGASTGVLNSAAVQNTFIGNGAGFINSGSYNTFIGSNAGSGGTGNHNVALGLESDIPGSSSSSIAIGYQASATASNQLVIGSGSGFITNGFFGNGVTNLFPSGFTLNATGGSGTNIVGADLSLAGGKSTGSANGGSVTFKTAAPGTSGTGLNSLVDRLTIDTLGAFIFNAASSTPTASSAGNGKLYFDSSTNKFKCSENTSAYFDCFGGTAMVTSIGAINGQTKSANGAVISANSLFMQTADASNPGLVSTGTQTFAGIKTFSTGSIFLDHNPEIIATGSNGWYTSIYQAGTGGGGQNVFRRADGTEGSPTNTKLNMNLGSFSFRGYDGSAFTGSKAFIGVSATEDWSGANTGTQMFFQTTSTASNTLLTRLYIDGSGNIGMGSAVTATTTLLDMKEPDSGTDLIIGLSAGTGARAQIRSVAQAGSTTSELSFFTTTGGTTSEAVRINSSKFLGVGTTAPEASIEITGTGQTTPAMDSVSGDTFPGAILLQTTDAVLNSGGAVVFGAGIDTFAAIKGLYQDGSSNGRGDIAFSTRTTGTDTTLTERMRITNGAVDVTGVFETNLENTASTTALCHSVNGQGAVNTRLRDCTGTPAADYMEFYSVTESTTKGDIVFATNNYITTKDGERIAKLDKATSFNQNQIIGIISDKSKAGDFNSIGYNINDTDNPQPIALSGRVPVKIDPSSDLIQVGDLITVSSNPGKGRKLNGSGVVVGKALESWAPGQETVMVIVQNYYHSTSGTTASYFSLNSSDLSTNQNLIVNGQLSALTLSIGNKNLNIDANGDLETKGFIEALSGLRTNKLTIKQDLSNPSSNTIGSGTLLAGTNSIIINNTNAKANAKIFITGLNGDKKALFVTNKTNGSFTVEIEGLATSDITFDYWIVQTE